jgi:hypothetical protein
MRVGNTFSHTFAWMLEHSKAEGKGTLPVAQQLTSGMLVSANKFWF